MDRERLKQVFRGIYRILFVLANNLYCIPTYLIWCMILQPMYYWSSDIYWMIEGQFFQWLLTMVGFWSYSADYKIAESGDCIDQILNDETLVLVNHQSTSDVPLLMHAFCSRNKLLQNLNWIMDAVFQYTNFGLVSLLHGDFFINAGRDRRDASLMDLENYLKTKFLPRKRKWLVLFPEGGFLRKRKEASKRYATKMNLPNLDYVTLPRLGALQTIINTLAPAASTLSANSNSIHRTESGEGDVPSDVPSVAPSSDGKLKYIVDLTLAYKDGDPLDLGSVITGSVPKCNIRMHYKIYPIQDVPYSDPNKLQTWLYNLYIQKNNMLGHYYRTGKMDEKFRDIDPNVVTNNQEDCKAQNKECSVAGTDVVDEARPTLPLLGEEENKTRKSVPFTSTPIDLCPTTKTESELDPNDPKKKSQANRHTTNRTTSAAEEPPTDADTDPDDDGARIIHLDTLRIFILHCMFISSTVLHIRAFYNLFSYVAEKTD